MILLIGLTVVIYLAVLGFGGTDKLVLYPVEAIAFLLAVTTLWQALGRESTLRLPWKGPVLLVMWVGIQSIIVVPPADVLYENLLRLTTYLCVFLVAFAIGRDRTLRARFVILLIILGLGQALYGLAQYLADWQYIFYFQKQFYTDQATGTYINANHFAGLLEMILPLAFAAGLYRLGGFRRSSQLHSRGEGGELAALHFLTSLLIYVAILFSKSRMGIFSATAALVGMGLLWASAPWRRRTGLVVLCGFMVGAFLVGAWLGLDPIVERYELIGRDYQIRLGIWRDTISLIKANPVFGTGLGTFADAYKRHQTVFLSRLVDHGHNDYLQFAAELGIPGALLLFGLILWVLRRGVSTVYRLERGQEKYVAFGCCGSIVAILFHSLADFNLQIPANALLFSAILGLALAVCDGGGQSAPKDRETSLAEDPVGKASPPS